MYRILKIGMDVHTTNYTLCALESKFGEEDTVLANITVGPDHKNVLDFVRRIKEKMDRVRSRMSRILSLPATVSMQVEMYDSDTDNNALRERASDQN